MIPVLPTLLGGTATAGYAMSKILDFVTKAKDVKTNYDKYTGNNSLVRMTSSLRVEPLCIVDNDCVHLPYASDIMQSMLSIFTGYYLQGTRIIGTVSGTQVARDLERLNPNRSPDLNKLLEETTALANRYHYSPAGYSGPNKLDMESYKWQLPRSNTPKELKSAMEKLDKDELYKENLKEELYKGEDGAKVQKDSLTAVSDVVNLSVGKLINVSIVRDGQSLSVPISIRLIVNTLPQSYITGIFGKNVLDRSFKERYYKWKAGRISFVGDLIFCRDLIREHKKAMMDDKQEVMTEIYDRATKNRVAGLISKTPSMSMSSNLYVISKETANAIRKTSGIDLTNFAQRQKLFDETYTMIMAVVDREYERVDFYHDSIRLPTNVGINDMKKANKDGGPSILDILNAYKQGKTPTL